MFVSKDLFEDDDNDTTPQTTYNQQPARKDYQSYQSNYGNYGNQKQGQDDEDGFDDVLSNIPSNKQPAQYNSSNTYNNNNNNYYQKPQPPQYNQYNQYNQSSTYNQYNVKQQPVKPTYTEPKKNANLMNMLYTNEEEPEQQKQPAYNNTNNDNKDDGFDFDLEDSSPTEVQPPAQKTTSYGQYQPHPPAYENSSTYSMNDDNVSQQSQSTAYSRPVTSSGRPGTATMDAKKKALQMQRENLLNQKNKRFAQTGTLTSNDMLNKNKPTSQIKYGGGDDINYDALQKSLQGNNGNFYDPTMMRNSQASNLPQLSSVDAKMTFQNRDDESPKNQHVQEIRQVQSHQIHEPETKKAPVQKQRPQEETYQAQTIKQEKAEPTPQEEEDEEIREKSDEEEMDEAKLAELEQKMAQEKEAHHKDKKDLKVEINSTPQQSTETGTPTLRLFQMNELDGVDMKRFLTSPLPRGALMQCTIKRDKSGMNRFYPKYICSISNGMKFLMAGKKRALNKTSNYMVSAHKDVFDAKSPHFLGKLRSNFLGTEFNIFDQGDNPKKATSIEKIREQLGVVMYESNLLGARGPRKMKVLIPDAKPTGEIYQFKPMSSKEGMLVNWKNSRKEGIKELFNKPPKWNEQVQAFVLNFNGRVEKPSVKNFQLIDEYDENTIYLQFGRITDDQFNMDFQWPLTPLQAFSICLSSFDYKLACE